MPATLGLQWAQENRPAGLPIHIPDRTVRAMVTNLDDQGAELELFVAVDFGGMETVQLPVGVAETAAASTEFVDLNLDAFSDQLEHMKYSGMVRFWARNASTRETATLPELYFHPGTSGLHVYDEQGLQEQFAFGDYQGLLSEMAEEGIVTSRILDASNAPFGDNDQLEPDINLD